MKAHKNLLKYAPKPRISQTKKKKKNTYIYMYVYICVCIQHIHIYIINFQKNPSIPWYNAKEEYRLTSQLHNEQRQRTQGFYCIAKLLSSYTNLVCTHYKNHPFVLQAVTLG